MPPLPPGLPGRSPMASIAKGIAARAAAAAHLHGAWLRQHHLTSNQSAAEVGTIAKPALAGAAAAAEVGAAGGQIQALWAFNREIGLWPPHTALRSTPDSSLPEVDFFLPAADRPVIGDSQTPSLDRDPLGFVVQIRQAAAANKISGRPAPSPPRCATRVARRTRRRRCSASARGPASHRSTESFPMDPPGRL
ncbi:hypothetical protein FB106_11423 [Synechococcus sp. Ace-Pa]|nr:hypothetical protein FB106_11423 [Synechococcus sp. Ace-Pa]